MIKIQKLSVSLIAGALSVGAQASFELLMQIDRPNGSSAMIRRFDPISGTYLGAFGAGYLNIPSALQVRNGTLYVLDSVNETATQAGRIHKFNPNTGEFLGSIQLQNWGKVSRYSSFDIDTSGNFYVSDGQTTNSYVNKYTSSGGYVNNNYWPFAGLNGLYGTAFNSAANRLYVDNEPNSSIDVFNVGSQAAAVQSVPAVGRALFMTLSNGYLYYTKNSTDNTVNRYTVAADGSLSGLVNYSVAPAGATLLGMGFGHPGNGYSAGYSSGVGTIFRFNGLLGDAQGSFGQGVLVNPWGSPVTIVAPEPSALAGLALGVLALKRRRPRNRF